MKMPETPSKVPAHLQELRRRVAPLCNYNLLVKKVIIYNLFVGKVKKVKGYKWSQKVIEYNLFDQKVIIRI